MKSWKKLLALLLALAMVFALAACADKDDDGGKSSPSPEGNKKGADGIVGEWEMELDMADIMNAQFESELGEMDIDEEFLVTLALSFEDDDTCKMEITVDEDSYDAYMDALADVLVDYLCGYGYSQSDAEDQVEAMLAEMDPDEINNSNEGVYKLDGDKLYMADDEDELEEKLEEEEGYIEIELDGDELKIVDADDDDLAELQEMGFDLPWVLERQ